MTSSPGQPLHLRFRRFECKYRITEGQAQAVRGFLKPYIEPDPFAARSPDGTYDISSLYLDSGGLRLYHETLDGIRDRYKLRVRAYTDRDADPVFYEVKKRRDRVISKERARVRRVDLATLLDGGVAGLDHMSTGERNSLESFRMRQDLIGARPRVMVRYRREAFQARFDRSVRVTFDRMIRARTMDRPGRFFDPVGWTTVEGGRVILELKFDDHCPPWLLEVIRRNGLVRTSYSKYALSVKAVMQARSIHI